MESASPSTRDRVSKRSSNACARCRRQKIKCSGAHPCGSCLKRRLPCEFDYRDQKMVVSRGYIMDLQQSIEEAERRGSIRRDVSESAPDNPAASQLGKDRGSSYQLNADPPASVRAASYVSPMTSETHNRQEPRPQANRASVGPAYPTSRPVGSEQRKTPTPRPEHREDTDPESSAIENPLALRHPEFTTSSEGTTYYLGTSSNWSFTRRVLALVHEHVYRTALPTQTLLFDGDVYNVDWTSKGEAGSQSTPKAALPTLDHAIYLINTVKFNCSQLFHLFEEDEFMDSCYKFYADPKPDTSRTCLWYVHFCLVVALGQALQSRQRQDKLPYGYELFLSTFKNLPNMGVLMKQPLVGIEILCCAALYLHCIDHRQYAHIAMGDALRIALFQGLHINMPTVKLGSRYVERCRRAWWTIYVLDCEMTSLMGLPTAMRESDATCPLPNFSGSTERIAIMDMQIRLYRILANINESLYGNSGNMYRNYTARAREALEKIAELADELRTSFPLHQKESMGGMSRMASHLHLLYYRCIILVTRPLLFSLLRLRFSSWDTYLDSLNSMRTARNLIHMCIDTSQKMVTILDCLLNQGLLSSFFHYDMEAAFVASTPLILGPVIDPQLSNGNQIWIRKTYAIFDDMIHVGNRVAGFRKAELQHLDEVARLVVTGGPCQTSGVASDLQTGTPMLESTATASRTTDMAPTPQAPFDPDILMGDGFMNGLTKEHILGVADAIADADIAWMCDAIIVQDSW